MTEPSVNKTCLSCPSYLAPDKVMSKFRKSVGTPVCGRYGHLLGRPGMKPGQADKIAKHYAKECDSFGAELPPVPVDDKFAVVIPDPDARVDIDEALKDACSSCAMCKNFVRDDTVADELGWTAGLCAAKGKLILPNRHMLEARGCDYRQFGSIRRNTNGLHLLPEFEDAFALNADPVKAYFKSVGAYVDPSDYPSDREVTAEESATGVRAWRRVQDPDGSGNEAFLPIYSASLFTDKELAKIPRPGTTSTPSCTSITSAASTWLRLPGPSSTRHPPCGARPVSARRSCSATSRG